MKIISRIIIAGVFALAAFVNVNAQETNAGVNYKILPESTMEIDGTSTLHNFEIKAKEVDGSLVLTNAADKGATDDGAQSLSSLKVVIPVKKLDTDKSSMNDNMYDALKADDNPNITYELQKVNAGVLPSVAGDSTQISTTGVLTIAGKQKVVEMNVTGSVTKEGKIQFKGQKKLLMTDFGVDPPTMLFGTIKTGNAVVIKFNLLLAKK